MKRFLILVVLLWASAAFGQGALSGYNGQCALGGQQVLVNALPSTGTQPIGTPTVSPGSGVIGSFPLCSVSVFLTGTVTKANLFSANTVSPPALGNPFTANADGSFTFFAAPGCYDIFELTGSGPTMPATASLSDVCLAGGSGSAGTVTSFQADATVGTLLTTTVASPTTVPFLHFTLAVAPPYTVFGNNQATGQQGQYLSIVTQMLPFTYSGTTLQLATVGVVLSHTSGAPICEDGVGNLKDTGCSSGIGVTSFNGRTGPVTSQTGDYIVSQVTGAAPLASPALTGTPTTPTPAGGDTSAQITNDQWVSTYFAVLASPAFTGVPTAPTAAANTNTTQIATTAFVIAQIGSGFAPLNSPAFTGVPTAPTAAVNTSTTQLATTAFVTGQAGTAVPIVDGTGTPGVSLLYARQDHVHPTDSSRAPLNNPVFTGIATSPAFVTGGTTFTASGCSNSGLLGGATGGKYVSGTSGVCTVIITMGGGLSAPNGWSCSVWDTTTPADVQSETAFSASTVTFSGTTVSGDTVVFGCGPGF
jgi:hypothetical protein